VVHINLIHARIKLHLHRDLLYVTPPGGTNVLLSPMKFLFYHMCLPWHIFSAYSEDVILQEVT
jgi:hypothetical protein